MEIFDSEFAETYAMSHQPENGAKDTQFTDSFVSNYILQK
jgi:hypothetical protein